MTTARELASRLRADLQGDESQWDTPLSGAVPLDTAGPGSLSFLASGKYRRQLPHTRASALLLRQEDVPLAPAGAALLVVEDPYLAYARCASRFSRAPDASGAIHPSAVLDASASIGAGVTVDANAVVGAGCHIGDHCWIGPGSVLGERVRLGRGSRLMANVTLGYDVVIGEHCLIHAGAVIGSDGFGFAPGPDGWEKIAQLGSVRIGSHVEIGANATIDRGAMADTVIEDGVIIDNLVHLAHNVRLGRGTALAAQVGISGSTEIGAGCTVGGQAGFAGHIEIADGSHFTGQAMVTKGTREAGVYSSGWPIQPAREWRRTVARLRQLDEFERRLKALEGAGTRLQPSNQEERE